MKMVLMYGTLAVVSALFVVAVLRPKSASVEERAAQAERVAAYKMKQAQEFDTAVLQSITYLRDPETETCFAYMVRHFPGIAGSQRYTADPSLAAVPCTPAVMAKIADRYSGK